MERTVQVVPLIVTKLNTLWCKGENGGPHKHIVLQLQRRRLHLYCCPGLALAFCGRAQRCCSFVVHRPSTRSVSHHAPHCSLDIMYFCSRRGSRKNQVKVKHEYILYQTDDYGERNRGWGDSPPRRRGPVRCMGWLHVFPFPGWGRIGGRNHRYIHNFLLWFGLVQKHAIRGDFQGLNR
jgi:hypothetical protein